MKKPILLLLMLTLFATSSIFAQEGTKQFMPNESDRCWILLHRDAVGFAEYGCLERERLNIYLEDGEVLHLGMQFNSENGGAAGVVFRVIKPDGVTAAISEMAVPTSGTGYIANYTQAVAGANGTIINGTTISGGYNAITYTANSTGNHYIEFNLPDNNERWIEFFDCTVTDGSNNIITNPNNPNASAGKLWSKQWQLTTTNFILYPLNMDFYVFTGDEFVNRVNFQMKPFHFNFVANDFGTNNTGDLLLDRQSFNGNAFEGNDVTAYNIFLNDPDQDAFPSTDIPPPVVKAWFNEVLIYDYEYNRTPQILEINYGTIQVEMNEDDCPDPSITFFKIETNTSGLSTILIDVNDDGFHVGTADRALITNVNIGMNYIPWDLKDNYGALVELGEISCIPQFLARGPAHFPIYDAEALNGIETYSVRPFEKFDPTLYWDDETIPEDEWGDDNGAMDETVVSQFQIDSDVPRIWTYFGENGGHDNGNNNTLSSWFYAIDLGMSSLDFEIIKIGCEDGTAPIVSDIYKSEGINTDITFTQTDFEDNYADPLGNTLNKIEVVDFETGFNGTLKLSGTDINAGDEITYADLPNITFTPETDWMGQTFFRWNGHNTVKYAVEPDTVFLNINTDPTISAIPDVNLCVNTTSDPIDFTVNDAAGETSPNDIIVSATSGNLNVVAIDGIVFGGSGENRTVTITPVTNMSGSARITIFADDGYSVVATSFWVIVGPSITVEGSTNICPGDALILTADEVGADSYSWNFGGSEIATTRVLTINPFLIEHVGEYFLTVTKGSCSGTNTFQVGLNHSTTFVGDIDVCDGGVLELVADEAPAAYVWRQGATIIGTNKTLTIDPVNGGHAATDYSLEVSKDGCDITSDDFEVTVNTPATTSLALAGNTVCEDEDGTATITSAEDGVIYEAYIGIDLVGTGTGTDADLDIAIDAAYLNIGANTIDFTANNGCTIAMDNQATVTVIDNPATYLNVAGNTVCLGEDGTVTITSAENGIDYEAFIGATSVGTGTGADDDLDITISAANLTLGANIIDITADNGTCIVTLDNQATVTVDAGPTNDLSTIGSLVCEGNDGTVTIVSAENGIDYELFIGATSLGTYTGTGDDLVITVDAVNLILGVNTVDIVATNPTSSCFVALVNSPDITVATTPASDLAITGENICENTDAEIIIENAEASVTYTAYINSTEVASGVGTGTDLIILIPSIELSIGDNTMEVIATFGDCTPVTLDETVIVNVTAEPNTELNVDGCTVCEGDDATVTVTNSETGVIYEAYIDATLVGTGTGTGDDLIITISNSDLIDGDNTVEIQASNTVCQNVSLTEQSIVSVTIFETESIMASGNSVVNGENGTVIVDPTQSDLTYEIYLSETTLVGSEEGTGQEIAISVLAEYLTFGDNIFTLMVTDKVCYANLGDVVITVIDDIIIPEGFSPNGDGTNETVIITGLEEYPNNSIIIINRWGNKVFEASPYNNDWDGTNMFGVSKGQTLPVGTYFYILDPGDGHKALKGYIYLNK